MHTTSQVAITAAQAAFQEHITCANDEAQATKWSEVQSQLGVIFAGTLERIKRRAAEEEVEFHKMLQQAKTEAIAVFDKEAFLEKLEALEDEEVPQYLFEVRSCCWLPKLSG